MHGNSNIKNTCFICCEVKFIPGYFMLLQFEYLRFVEGEDCDGSMQIVHGTGKTQSVIP